ncbi:MAG: cyanophycin synthetase, partial [Clostridia bacterium]
DGEDIVKAITTIPQVDHRLQRSRTPSGITIIDDGYNSNPDGARLALETLGLFVGRKIVASQGLVELGAKEVEENYILGQKIAEIADIAILIGRNAYNLQKGVLSKNFDKNKIFLTDSLAKAQELFATLLRSGDVLLLQNDLPDNY